MKTIEEAAIEYAVKESEIDNSKSVEFEQQLYAHELMYAFQAGVEFANRWIPVEEELPPINEVVLLKTDFNFIVGVYTGNNKFRALTFSCLGVKNVEINNITHWRPI